MSAWVVAGKCGNEYNQEYFTCSAALLHIIYIEGIYHSYHSYTWVCLANYRSPWDSP